ncbi:MAG: ABC transporter permease subunit [Chloroflexi bacterium]|nr:ABC transporter permease subunit [Chloroflexota bacterium]
MTATTTSDSPNIEVEQSPTRLRARLRRWFGNWKLSIGVALLAILLIFSIVGSLRIPFKETRVGWGDFGKAPSEQYPLGTDAVGRDMLALMVHGIHPSLKIGLIAGILGTVVGTVLGLVAGYSGGVLDTIISTAADIMLTIPALMILVVLASYLRTTTIELMALIIALFAWAGPTRLIRSQALSLRERPFVPLAKLSGQGDFEIAIRQILPNLLPYVMAGFVGSVSGAVLASVGIQLLGLGPLLTPNLGMILNNAFTGAALFRNMWWWWGPPALALIILFVGLFLISIALDEYANPRLRGEGQ